MDKEPEWLQCVMCGAANAFKIDPVDPATGYCRVEDKNWTIKPGAAMIKVGVFSRVGKRGKILYSAYTTWYSPEWTGCCEHLVVRGPDAKTNAIAQHKRNCETQESS